MQISVENVYTSVACNRMPEIVDWNNDGLICFGASNAIVIYDTNVKVKDPLTVHTHHSSRVNSVRWLRKKDGTCTEIVSCSADKTAAIWSCVEGVWEVTSKLTGHKDGVTCVFGMYTSGDDLYIYTTSIDSTVKVWERCNGETQLKQTISLHSGLCLTLHAHYLPIVNKPLLFCAVDDHKIHVFAGEEYHRVHTLVGHEDWVRGLDVIEVDDSIMLASASQDTYIRLWRIHRHTLQEPSPEIKVEEKVFPAYGVDWSVKLDAVLAGHEGWVYGVQWHPYAYNQDKSSKKPVYRLLSSSLDKTVIVWEPEGGAAGAGGGVWVERVRVGEVGGNGLGFYGSRFGPDGRSFLGHGYNGSFHIWTLCEETNQWEPSVVCGGHFAPVEDVRWEPNRGRYIMSVSADQTNRVHAPWKRNGSAAAWHEIARPQVHGYDLCSVALVDSVTFASAAEEKVIRVFRAPHNFLHNFKSIVGDELVPEDAGVSPAEGASVPSLGLSNKAVFAGAAAGDDADGYFVPVSLTEPPTEETLMQNTLWPEVQKLYGHGYEVFALHASADGALLASACRATAPAHAAVLLWETTNWQQIQKLVSHQLTVTQLAFSPDSQQLLSVSRDRKWTLYRRVEGSNSFELEAGTDKTNGVHSRIIWCCAWAHDSAAFATGSRDGKVCMWTKTADQQQSSLQYHALAGAPLDLANSSVTALAIAPVPATAAARNIVAVGLESGRISIYAFGTDGWSLLHEMSHGSSHHLTVKRLAFNPRGRAVDGEGEGDEEGAMLLASAGADHLVRVHAVTIS